MAANKVIVNNQTIIDLTADTVTAATLKKGVTAHDASGAQITGTMESGGGGSTSETWVLDSAAYYPSGVSDNVTFNADFTSNGLSFSSILITASLRRQILYDRTVVKSFDSWASEAYRKLTFSTAPTGDLLAWLEKYGVKQPANLAVQPSKDVTITSNGTTEITPDAPYDVMEKANVTVDVASVSTVTINCDASDTSACYLDPSGMWHTADKLNRGANEILVAQKTPIFIYNMYGYSLDSLVNLTYSGAEIYIVIHTGTATIGPNPYKIYYATDAEASAHMQTD